MFRESMPAIGRHVRLLTHEVRFNLRMRRTFEEEMSIGIGHEERKRGKARPRTGDKL